MKVRYAPFVTQTHGHRLAVPTVAAAPLRQAALAALDKFTGRAPGAAARSPRRVRRRRPLTAARAGRAGDGVRPPA